MVSRIKQLCKENRVPLKRLEEMFSLGQNSIYRWDKSYPSIDKVAKIAQFFGVSIDYLFFGESSVTASNTEKGADVYTENEVFLVSVYRSLSDDRKENVDRYLLDQRDLSVAEKKQGKSAV